MILENFISLHRNFMATTIIVGNGIGMAVDHQYFKLGRYYAK